LLDLPGNAARYRFLGPVRHNEGLKIPLF
jgi:hypothetical protein